MPLHTLSLPVFTRTSKRAALAMILCAYGASAHLAAAECACGRCAAPRWQVVETSNLRVLNFGPHAVDRCVVDSCESLRLTIARKWLGAEAANLDWTPKCDIVLHHADSDYLREVGSAGRNTLASSLVDRKLGRIVLRRIDVRSSQPDWQTSALAHELTHLVLADRVAGPLPRWADEGAAILADTAEKQHRHLRDLHQALSSRSEFRVVELLTLGDYPASQRWGAFYGQSASLVQFLVAQGGEQQFVRFLEANFEHGHERAMQQIYGMGIAEVERRWREQLKPRLRG